MLIRELMSVRVNVGPCPIFVHLLYSRARPSDIFSLYSFQLRTPMDSVTKDNTLGALLFGGLVASILYGVTSMQTVIYYYQRGHSRSADGWLIRTAVPLLWILATIDMGLIYHFLYSYLIFNYGNFASITASGPIQSLNLHFTVIALTQSVVRFLCAKRVRVLSHSWWPVIPIYVLTLVDVGSNLALGIMGARQQAGGIGNFEQTFDTIVYVNFSSSVAGDTLVAIFLFYLLQKSRTSIRSTDSMVKRIVVYVITTGLLTTIVQSVALVLFLLSSRNFVYLAVLTQVSKLYINAYLALLNDRDRLRKLSHINATVSSSRFQTGFSTVSFSTPVDIAPGEKASPTLDLQGEFSDSGFTRKTQRLDGTTCSIV
ncbi:hypothetical protein BDY19DRAFT_345224 [Irpex rosettiformis]|uniref:Uncharacterized protein n=1 Tax=Irpex rosettiformis TaxID=378272 RepID=A0ACB8TWX8_9APHY|nr:hypothetical protein BDY19DRAFT_345224 [Irpex rosettiformis]